MVEASTSLGADLFVVIVEKALKEGREPDLSDYKDFKLTCENIGYQMLQKLGWQEGEGLGSEGQGIKAPVNKYVWSQKVSGNIANRSNR